MLGGQKNIADDIINYLKLEKQGTTTFINEIVVAMQKHGDNQNDVFYVIKILKLKGFIEYTSEKQDYCFLTDKGWLYKDYDKVLAEEKYQADLLEKQKHSSINKNWAEKHPFWFAVIIAIISGIISWTVGKLQQQSKNQEYKQLQQRVETLSDSIAIFQKHITDSSKHN